MGLKGKIGFIGGGKMGEALLKGLLKAKVVKAEQVCVFDSSAGCLEHLKETYGVNACQSNKELVTRSNVIILAVKPQVMAAVLDEIRPEVTPEHLVISIAAGIPLRYLEDRLPEKSRVIRVMPNTPALIGEGATALAKGKYAGVRDLQLAEQVFSAVGRTVIVEEKYLDAVTGLSGSGPAYVFAIMEAFIDAGVRMGLSREVARVLTLQTVLGSVKLAMETGEHLGCLKEMVTSPGGTTIAGLHVMAKAGFNGILMDTVEAATRRSQELREEVLKS
ncbi:MAG: pyrroline-5-carboxylate reductase [Thermodesulfobacteriota bacterium]|nr:pyrroline-5-carboxylate reductase [Thermodesulfobacteriota bacterium]